MSEMADKNEKKGRGRKYWRSLDELADTPKFRAFLEREFPAKAAEWMAGASRRGFLKLMGASVALAGLASCRRWPEEQVLPYGRRPENRMDGVPVHYATALEISGVGLGVLATSMDGRPIKIEGNPEHPLNKGATDAYTQATILDLYDPERSGEVTRLEGTARKASTWDAFFAQSRAAFGGKVAVLSEASRSPSVQRLRGALAGATWYEYEPISNDNARAGAKIAFGQPLRPVLALDKARVIVAIDIDLFSGNPESTKWARDFAAGRRLHEENKLGDLEMNRLYAIESNFTLTGSSADHRRAAKPSAIAAYAQAIADGLGLAGYKQNWNIGDVDLPFVETLVKDLKSAGTEALVVAGPRQPAAVHAAVAAINAQLKAIGTTVHYYVDEGDPRPQDASWQSHGEQLASLVEAINAGKVETLLILGGNPVFNAPADLKFAEALAKLKTSIHLSTHEDETSRRCTWHLPRAHYLESWGDVRAIDGTVSITQPLIEPLFGGKSVIELLALLTNQNKTRGMDIVRETLGGDEWKWKDSLFHGVVAGTTRQAVAAPAVTGDVVNALRSLPKAEKHSFEIALYAGNLYDGRFANNGWLQEMPEAMTRLTWDNAALMSPQTAKTLGVVSDDVVIIEGVGGAVELSVLTIPGVAEDTIAAALGYGREIGSLAKGSGSDVFKLMSKATGLAGAVKVRPAGKRYLLATVQDHNIIDPVGKNRLQKIIPDLVLEGTFDEFKKNPTLGAKKVLSLSMWNEHTYDGHKWGMAIDLTTCTGCSACVVACQAENNIPIVGKEQVMNGRELHWIRVDRYFKTDEHGPTAEKPQAVHQVVMCMHCETAPCEEVCPVAATTHSSEGLNMMTYNRCIGTRYCSNNCPYKVRRFNYFDYNAGTTKDLYTPNIVRSDINELRRMQKNPQVTVRSRGVMEKCTYCVQRIENVRITAFNEGKRAIKDGEITTACAQACPTQAIVFGDLNDRDSRVHKLHAVARAYGLLDPELNTKPRTRYIAKVRNPAAGLDAELFEHEGHAAASLPGEH